MLPHIFVGQFYLPVTHVTYPISTHFSVIFPQTFWSSKWATADASYKILHLFLVHPILATYTVSCSTLWTFPVRSSDIIRTRQTSQQASVLCSIKALCICAATREIYVSDHKTLILPESYEANESQFFHMDGFVIRAGSICPRCTRACRLIVRPGFRCSYFRRQVPPHPYDTRDPSSERWNCGRECWPVILPKCRYVTFRDLLHAANL
jgi:hypothetical protein